jgi:DNA-binding MarR family transcriptional regulator
MSTKVRGGRERYNTKKMEASAARRRRTSKTANVRTRQFIHDLDVLSELLTPARKAQDADAPECTRTELRVLAALGRAEPIAMTALALSLGVPASTLSRAIEQLVKKGLVERRRDRDDRRIIEVGFSPYGKEINRFVVGSRLQMAKKALRKLGELERDRLFGSLAKLVKET